MLKSEFVINVERILDRDHKPETIFNISEEAYRIVEHVYTYYPGMTKEIAAQLFVWFGLRIFKDLTDKANMIAALKIMLDAERG